MEQQRQLNSKTGGQYVDMHNDDTSEQHENGQYNIQNHQRESEQESQGGMKIPESLAGQFWMVITLSAGPIISMFFYMLVQLINTYYIGHSNDPPLIAGVGMGNMLINVLAFAPMQGLNGALETLISQAYGTSNNVDEPDERKRNKIREQMRKACGVYYNRGRFVVTVLMVPIILIFVFTNTILENIGQDAAVAHKAWIYVLIMIPGVWSMGQFDSTKKFLSAQFKTKIPVRTQIVTTILHFGWCQLFITHLDMEEKGAAIATNITYILNMLIADIWIRMNQNGEFKNMVFFYDSTVFQELGQFLKIGISGMLMLCFEWWAFELLAIFTGLLGVVQLAAEVVIINMITFIFMLPLGISYTASALTGNFIGEGKIALAKRFAIMTIVLDVILTSIVVLLIGIYQDGISRIFTKEVDVVGVIHETLWVLLIYIWFDTIHGVQSGIIRGLGLQAYGFIYTLICYYIIGMPLALVLAFTFKMGIQGLWLGYSIACIILDIGFFFIISCPNWAKIGDKMKENIAKGKIVESTPLQSVRNQLTPKGQKRTHHSQQMEFQDKDDQLLQKYK